MFAQGDILTGVESQAILIPAAAVYRDDRSAKASYVFVVENGKAARRNVRIGRETRFPGLRSRRASGPATR